MRLPWLSKAEDAQDQVRGGVNVRPREKSKGSPWALDGVINHVTFAGDRMIAWYLASPQTWSFRSVAEGEALIAEQAEVYAELVGTTVYGRVTSRPYPVHHWAQRAWENAADPQPGFDAMMERDQLHMAAHSQADKLVYYGVDLGHRGLAVKMLSRALSGAVDRETQALQDRIDAVDALMAGGGLSARPALGQDMEWLLARSFALGCPVPVPDLAEEERLTLTAEDLQEWVSTSSWSAEPLAASTKVTTSVNDRQVTSYVVVLTVSRMADVSIPESHSPWMAKADQLGFPYEMAFRVVPRSPEEVMKEMTKLADRIDGQVTHWTVDHGKRPPKQLARQAARAAEVEDQMRSSFTGLDTRTRGWYRIAVSGATEREALDRAREVRELYGPQVKVVRELGQFALAREFVPGEPLASTANVRHFPVLKVAASLPMVAAQVGDRRGFHIAETAGIVGRAVHFDPWALPERVETSGVVPIVGAQGSGKSTLMGLITYKSTLSGVYGVGMDPAGRLNKMLDLPEMRPLARSVNLLGSGPGGLSPYAVVPDPVESLVRLDLRDDELLVESMERAYSAAEQSRRDLAEMTTLWCLPYAMSQDQDVRKRLHRVIMTAPAYQGASLNVVIELLEQGDSLAQEIAQELRISEARELGRLFFASSDGPADTDSDKRFTLFNLRGMMVPPKGTPMTEWSPDELMTKPILALAAWSCLQLIYRRDPNERKLFMLDETQEVVDTSSAGRALTYKLTSDSRKNDLAALLGTQNAGVILGQNINNFVGACFVGRTQSREAQEDALAMLGKPAGQGYEEMLGRLSQKPRDGGALPYRDFIFSDGLGGEATRGGMERIQVTLNHHPALKDALNTTADPHRRVRNLRGDDRDVRDTDMEEAS